MPSAWEVTRVTLSVGGAPSSLVRQTGSFAFAGASTQAFAHDLDRPAFQAGGQGQHPPAPTLASGGQDFAVHRSRHAFMNWSVRGLVRYEITVRSSVRIKLSTGIPGMSFRPCKRANSASGTLMRTV